MNFRLRLEADAREDCWPRSRVVPEVASSALEQAIGELGRAYNERPVTLSGAIYRIADSKIQSFSDSFRLRDD
jgi:hypothetical protein